MPAWLQTPSSLAWAVFALAALVSAVVTLIVSRDAIFTGDEWGILYRLTDKSLPVTMFDAPAGKYLIAVPTLVYAALAETFGADSYLPYRLLGILLTVLAAGLFLALAKRKVALGVAVACSLLLLFLGAAWEVTAIPGRVPGQMALCAGLAMLLALDRKDRPGDLAACGLGTLAILSHPIALAFLAAAIAIVCLERPRDWMRSLVFLVPLLVYGLWYATLRESVEEPFPTTLGEDLSFTWDTFVALCATVAGIFRSPWTETVDFSTTGAQVIAILALIVGAIAVGRARRVSVGLAAALLALIVNLIAPALTGGGFLFRAPDAPRYLYPGTIFLLLVLVEVVALRRLPTRTAAVVGAAAAIVFVFGLVANVTQLADSARDYGEVSKVHAAELGSGDLAREGRTPAQLAADQGITLERSSAALSFIIGAPDPEAVAGAVPAYVAISDEFGGPADSAAEIRDAPLAIRQSADRVLVATIPAHLRPSLASRPPAGPCRPITRASLFSPGGRSASLRVPRGRLYVDAADGRPPSVTLGRFADQPAAPVRWPRSNPSRASLVLAETGLPDQAWSVRVDRTTGIIFCGEAAR